MNYYKITLNPSTNKNNAEKDIPQIMQLMHASNLKFEIALTKQPGHASELAQKAVQEGFNVMLAADGDGTCNEVINGVMLSKKQQKPTWLWASCQSGVEMILYSAWATRFLCLNSSNC